MRQRGIGARGRCVALRQSLRHTPLAPRRDIHIRTARAPQRLRESNPGVDLTLIPLDDPTNIKPWYDADIKVFCRAACDAREQILAGKKVAFLCKAGLNRSPTLAKMASRGMKSAGVAMPVDEALCELAVCDTEAAAIKLGPIGVRKQRKRSWSDA